MDRPNEMSVYALDAVGEIARRPHEWGRKASVELSWERGGPTSGVRVSIETSGTYAVTGAQRGGSVCALLVVAAQARGGRDERRGQSGRNEETGGTHRHT
eukprot:6198239-Pleurochrysis_carterae.AAC.5